MTHTALTPTPMMQLHEAMPWLSNARLVGDGSTPILRVHSDTRSLLAGDLFAALQGEHFDANTMLAHAQAQGASALLCEAGRGDAHYPVGIPRIEVPNTRIALGELAKGWRAQCEIALIAITGSNGKTTVTQMLASILQAYGGTAAAQTWLATQGNLNNDVGVPMTVLRLRPQHRIAAVELGMNHPGEIASLAAIAQPTVALVNNAQREHLEFMHTVQAVAEENGSVIRALPTDGVAVFPADDGYTAYWTELAAPRQVARFALSATNDTRDLVCTHVQWHHNAWQVRAQSASAELQFSLHIAGRHNVKNALAAASCALAAGVSVADIVAGLEAFRPVKGRSRALALGRSNGNSIGNSNGSGNSNATQTLVDDSYNANPDSVHAAIDVLADLPSPRLLVLGDMGEVGERGAEFHAEAGEYAQARGIESLYAIGTLAQASVNAFAGAQHFATIEALNQAVALALPHTQSILVKGSRFMRMERVVEAALAFSQQSGNSAPSDLHSSALGTAVGGGSTC